MQSEFESLLGQSIEFALYVKIEKVYVFYPGIKDKQHIVQIYKDFGMILIDDMLKRADKIELLESEIQTRKAELAKLK